METGVGLIAAERVRQIEEEGWTPGHDAGHSQGEIAWAAVCYAAPDRVYREHRMHSGRAIQFIDPWPWDPCWDKRVVVAKGQKALLASRVRELVKAGALIAAEIDRLLREE